MPRLPALTPTKLLKLLQENGFVIDRVTGGHYILYHKETGLRVTIPFHRKDIPKGTLHAIFKASGIEY